MYNNNSSLYCIYIYVHPYRMKPYHIEKRIYKHCHTQNKHNSKQVKYTNCTKFE